MSSQIEEIVSHVGLDMQQLFPDAGKLRLQQVAWTNALVNTFKRCALDVTKRNPIHFATRSKR